MEECYYKFSFDSTKEPGFTFDKMACGFAEAARRASMASLLSSWRSGADPHCWVETLAHLGWKQARKSWIPH